MDPQLDYFVVWPHNNLVLSPERWKILQLIVVVAAGKPKPEPLWQCLMNERETYIYIYIFIERESESEDAWAVSLSLLCLLCFLWDYGYKSWDMLRPLTSCVLTVTVWEWDGSAPELTNCPNTRVISIHSLSYAQSSQRLSHTLQPQTDLNSVLTVTWKSRNTPEGATVSTFLKKLQTISWILTLELMWSNFSVSVSVVWLLLWRLSNSTVPPPPDWTQALLDLKAQCFFLFLFVFTIVLVL